MGGWFYRVSGVYQPLNYLRSEEVKAMRSEAVLRLIGEDIARRNAEKGVSERFAAIWLSEWQEICDMIVAGKLSVEKGKDALCTQARRMVLAQFIAGLGE